MGGTAIHLLGIEQGNATMLSQSYNISSDPTDPVSCIGIKEVIFHSLMQLIRL